VHVLWQEVGQHRVKNTAANFLVLRYTRVGLLFGAVLEPWAVVAVLASCVFFNMGVFYHPPGVFYPMGCYKMPKIISKIKSYATRPFQNLFFSIRPDLIHPGVPTPN
jgi:hypothetical protein